MSYFEAEERRLCEEEKEEAELIASNEYQKEIDKQKEKNSIAIDIVSQLNSALTDIIIEETKTIEDTNVLSYFEIVSSRFGQLMQDINSKLEKGEKIIRISDKNEKTEDC